MKITIHRGVKGGRRFFRQENELGIGTYSSLSRAITGTTGERGLGVFEEGTTERFHYGNVIEQLSLPELRHDMPLADLAKAIRERVTIVSAWVSAIDYTESIAFDV